MDYAIYLLPYSETEYDHCSPRATGGSKDLIGEDWNRGRWRPLTFQRYLLVFYGQRIIMWLVLIDLLIILCCCRVADQIDGRRLQLWQLPQGRGHPARWAVRMGRDVLRTPTTHPSRWSWIFYFMYLFIYLLSSPVDWTAWLLLLLTSICIVFCTNFKF